MLESLTLTLAFLMTWRYYLLVYVTFLLILLIYDINDGMILLSCLTPYSILSIPQFSGIAELLKIII